jgi:hypothetical protein
VQRISPLFGQAYFDINFGFKSPIYVDLKRENKAKNKLKRCRSNDEVIFTRY